MDSFVALFGIQNQQNFFLLNKIWQCSCNPLRSMIINNVTYIPVWNKQVEYLLEKSHSLTCLSIMYPGGSTSSTSAKGSQGSRRWWLWPATTRTSGRGSTFLHPAFPFLSRNLYAKKDQNLQKLRLLPGKLDPDPGQR